MVVRLDGVVDHEDLRRRRDIHAVLHPRTTSGHRYLDWAVGLAVLHGWTVIPASSCLATMATRTIETPPLLRDEDLACFVHEGGHLEDPDMGDRDHLVIEHDGRVFYESWRGELFAWQWAIDTLRHRWNATMQRHMQRCLHTYHRPGLVRRYEDVLARDAVIAAGAERIAGGVRIGGSRMSNR